ncbi:hypothetical protein A2U01_0001860, partial [Trifolium medium]|nr:hypothetical protein [Trifolium medium]
LEQAQIALIFLFMAVHNMFHMNGYISNGEAGGLNGGFELRHRGESFACVGGSLGLEENFESLPSSVLVPFNADPLGTLKERLFAHSRCFALACECVLGYLALLDTRGFLGYLRYIHCIIKTDTSPMARQVDEMVALDSGTMGKGTCKNVSTLTLKSVFERGERLWELG